MVNSKVAIIILLILAVSGLVILPTIADENRQLLIYTSIIVAIVIYILSEIIYIKEGEYIIFEGKIREFKKFLIDNIPLITLAIVTSPFVASTIIATELLAKDTYEAIMKEPQKYLNAFALTAEVIVAIVVIGLAFIGIKYAIFKLAIKKKTKRKRK